MALVRRLYSFDQKPEEAARSLVNGDCGVNLVASKYGKIVRWDNIPSALSTKKVVSGACTITCCHVISKTLFGYDNKNSYS